MANEQAPPGPAPHIARPGEPIFDVSIFEKPDGSKLVMLQIIAGSGLAISVGLRPEVGKWLSQKLGEKSALASSRLTVIGNGKPPPPPKT